MRYNKFLIPNHFTAAIFLSAVLTTCSRMISILIVLSFPEPEGIKFTAVPEWDKHALFLLTKR